MLNRVFVICLTLFAFSPAMAQKDDSDQGNPIDEFAIKDVNYFPGLPNLGGNIENYTGDTTGGPLWDRPFASGTCCSSLGPVTYEIQPFYVETAGNYDFSSNQNDTLPDQWDGYLFVYVDGFDPLDQLTGFVAGDDDGTGGVGTSDIDGVPLEANRLYYVVTTGFADDDFGTYMNSIEGPGVIRLGPLPSVPTLGEWGMIGFISLLAMTGLIVVRRSKVA